MSVKLQLESLLSNNSEYDSSIHSFLTSIEKSRDRVLTIKNIILFCKNSLSITSKPMTKFLVIKLINDIINLVDFQQVASLIENNILKKVLDACLTHKRSRVNNLNDDDKKWHQQFVRIAIESIYYWGSLSNNTKSSFYKAAEQLREKDIQSSRQVKTHINYGGAAQNRPEPKQRVRAKSVSYQDTQKILKFKDLFQQIQLLVEDEFKKSERNHSYRIKIGDILEMLTNFIIDFKSIPSSLRKGVEYNNILDDVSVAEQFLSKFQNKKSVGDKQIRRYIEDIFFDREEAQTEPQKKKFEYSEGIQLKKLDIFEILQNIHRRIEQEQKAAGVFGNYEMKNILIQDQDKYQSLNVDKNKSTNDIRINRFI